MNNYKICSVSGSLLFLLSLALLIWTQWPVKPISRVIVFQPGKLQVPPQFSSIQKINTTDSEIPKAFLETKIILLEWTPVIRLGDHSQINLSFTREDTTLNDNISDIDENPTTYSNFENIYNEYTINAEARVEISGLNVKPEGVSGQVYPEDKDIAFIWKIYSDKEGFYAGTTWLYLQYYPRLGGEIIEQAISAQSFDIKVVSFLGIKSNYWRVVGVLGIIIGIYIQKKHIIGLISKTYRLFANKSS